MSLTSTEDPTEWAESEISLSPPKVRSIGNILLRPSTLDDIEYFSKNLREADKDEIQAGAGKPPYDILLRGYNSADICTTVEWKGLPLLICGISEIEKEVGNIWMLGTEVISKEARLAVLRMSKPMIDEFHKKWSLLFNFVDKRNTVHIKWLRWLGFKFINLHQEFGVGKLPFYEFVRRK